MCARTFNGIASVSATNASTHHKKNTNKLRCKKKKRKTKFIAFIIRNSSIIKALSYEMRRRIGENNLGDCARGIAYAIRETIVSIDGRTKERKTITETYDNDQVYFHLKINNKIYTNGIITSHQTWVLNNYASIHTVQLENAWCE